MITTQMEGRKTLTADPHLAITREWLWSDSAQKSRSSPRASWKRRRAHLQIWSGERDSPAANDLPITMRLAEPPVPSEWLRSA